MVNDEKCVYNLSWLSVESGKKKSKKNVYVSNELNSFVEPFGLYRKILAEGYLGKISIQIQSSTYKLECNFQNSYELLCIFKKNKKKHTWKWKETD